MGAKKTWPSIFVTAAAFFKVSSLPAGTEREGGGGGEGSRVKGRGGPASQIDRAGDCLKQTLKDSWVLPESALLVSGGVVH